MELERIYFDTFFLYAFDILKDYDNILYMKNKVTEHVESCYLWTGPSCILCNTPLIQNESVVYGIANDPQSISAKDFVEGYEFTTMCFNRPAITKGSKQYKNMLKAKELVEAAAKRASA